MIETKIQTRLATLAGGRVYAGVAPSPVARPYITHFHMGGELGVVFSGADGSDEGSVQIDCWADSRGAATALGWEVFHTLAAPGPDFAIDSIRRLPSAHEPDTKLHRVSWEVAVTTETPDP